MKKTKAKKVNKKISKEQFERSARIYKLLANPKRLELLTLLNEREMTVSELVEKMGVRKANASQHLAILRYLRLVTVRREGKNAFYKISDSRIADSFATMNDFWKDSRFDI